MLVRLLLAVIGAFHLANGVAMLVAPRLWAASVVHLTSPDHLHLHFIADIGMAFVASGVGLLLGARRGALSGAFAIAGAAWPLLHAVIHVSEWLTDGPPAAVNDALNEGVGVILIGFLGVALAWVRFRKGDV